MTKRRGKGEGSIFRGKNDSWIAELTLPNGKKRRKYASTYKAVKDWLEDQKQSVKDGLVIEDERISIAQFLDQYLDDVAAHTLRPKTIQDYSSLIRKHIIPEIGNVRLSALTPSHLQHLYSKKLEAGLSRRSVQYIHAVIHKALNHALKQGLVARNVADAVDAPRPSQKAPEVWNKDQVRVFFDDIQNHKWKALWIVAVTTGMRQGEILGLRKADVDLADGVIQVRQTTQTLYKKGIVISEPKTEKARRSIPIPKIAIEALEEHLDHQQVIKASAKEWVDYDLVFCTGKGTPISARNLLREFEKVLEVSGLPKIRFHDLRHTSATLLLIAGVHPKVVQERLGHSRIDMTLDIYSHVIPSMQKEAADKMDVLLGN